MKVRTHCKGGEQVAKVGEGGGAQIFDCGTVTTVRLWVYAHSPPRGVWGHAPPENFGNFNSLRAFLMQSGSSFWTDIVAILLEHSFANTQNYVTVICSMGM